MTSNYLLNLGFMAWACAQLLKTLFTLILTKRFVSERLYGSGGMPSSHSALVCALSMGMVKKVGFSSPVFALTLIFAGIVMYDAMGVRHAAGEQAKMLNKIIGGKIELPFVRSIAEQLELVGKRPSGSAPERAEADREEQANEDLRLKEYLGHTPLEVLGGALLGILIAMVFPAD